MQQEEKLKTVSDFTYLGDRVSAGGGCEAAVTARTRFGWIKFRSVVSCCMSYVRSATLYGSLVMVPERVN